MPKYANITHKATFYGTCWGGSEEWSTSLWLGNTSGGDVGQAPSAQQAASIAEAWKTFFTSPAAGIGNQYLTTGVKISHVNTLGKADAALTQFHTFQTTVAGNSASFHYPPQITVAATMTSDLMRGHGSKGRMYLPGVTKGLGANGHMHSTGQGELATAFNQFLSNVNSAAGNPYRVVLNAAEVTGVPFRAARMEIVTGCKIGSVFDTQQRRRNQLREQYVTRVLTA
jgi:hypothetical protein